MFGYVTVYKPEMKVKEFEIYNAIYCGLCRHIGKTYGPFAKLSLNYDMTFISLLQMALYEGQNGYEQRACRANPLKKCTYCKDDASAQDFAAAVTMALTDAKIVDNIRDSHFFKALIYRFLRLFSKRWSKKAYKKYPDLKVIINDYCHEQLEAEGDENCSVDRASEPSAKAIGKILSMLDCEAKYGFVLERMGYCIGKWVYLCDAADDLEKDIKKHRFNPLKTDFKGDTHALSYAKQRIEPVMNTCWTECAKYMELLDIKKYKSIIDNILYDGMKHRQKKIFKEEI